MSNAATQKRAFSAVLWDYLTTVDHKKVGILYLMGGGFFFLLGGLEALIIRIQLIKPENDFITAGLYNEMITMHGTTMIFLAATPLLFGLMNYIMPLQIGARDVAFPFLNALGFWLFFSGGILLNCSWFLGGAPDAGWTAYAPLSIQSPGHGTDFYVMGLQLSGAGTLMSGINFLVTIVAMRAPGMTYMRMPLFTWTTFVTSVLTLFAFPALTVGLFLLMFDRMFGSAFFDVALGGNSVIWQHLFWIFGHPEVYILILPVFGVFSEVLPTFSKKRLFGYSAMVFATFLIAFLGFMVWAHHMFTVGLGPVANSIFAVATMAIAVPTGIKIFNWLFTMWGGSIVINSAMLWALAFIPSFTIGGMTGVMLGSNVADYQYHDSYFVVAHFHYVIVGGVVFGLFAACHYWWPKMFGRILHEGMGKLAFWTFFIGFHLTFFIQHFLGLMGMPRRYWVFLENQGLDTGNLISTIGAFFMTIGTIVFLINIVYTAVKGEKAPADPWDARTLEWTIPSPPPFYNFKQMPLVRGLDPLWIEKTEGNGKMTPAEPLDEIHMPNGSILPLIMTAGFFIASFGFIYQTDHKAWLIALYAGMAIAIGCMVIRSLKDDLGFHISKEELEREAD
ncbi:cytochrome c oxidase subunit I [Oceanobacillus profundus]|uniref:Cytochrome c oxidase subunit 1 n=1 Tax=Oceanobacillus profundus TaxID=372463 RepID=A0A417YKL9_9BACI|nr:cytochrome c oxidase subunit I [Oceanobacillus profundus]MBR3119986.1 cytochrome c oxidase subunit I [Oceanobacillus sp.]PAE30152.1 cytochrome c oxidase subunit I [Paenibacillus sp. 7884-2]MCM3396220.1 cytochrome c oxidase subunit I [Oceanobacillus profundus]MDO6449770.1 cytochrome c oxidase subunit I [Oceanobacillus profundus]RHW33772.1 cytochrome c oxidase subunit I [Oceanobacillus profundus]